MRIDQLHTSIHDLQDVADVHWDTVVIGAGPAGAVCAYELARNGVSVLLVDKNACPRWKVCGGCLTALGLDTLQKIGLLSVLDDFQSPQVERVDIHWKARHFSSPLRAMRAVSREDFDSRLVLAAKQRGARVLTGVQASMISPCRIQLRLDSSSVVVETKTIVRATGLDRSTDPYHGENSVIAKRSWIGTGVTIQPRPQHEIPWGVLTMAIGPRGYLGRLRLGDGRVNWAAAIDPDFVRSRAGILDALRRIWQVSDLDPDELPDKGWKGTPRLTRCRPVQEGSVFSVGDAAGFVEPITGEGMSWAIATGVAVVPCVFDCLRSASMTNWPIAYRQLMRSHRLRCAMVVKALRWPKVMSAALRLAQMNPTIGHSLIGHLISDRPAHIT